MHSIAGSEYALASIKKAGDTGKTNDRNKDAGKSGLMEESVADDVIVPALEAKQSGHLKVLIVEDNPDDAELLLFRLEGEGFILDWVRVDTRQAYLDNLEAPVLPDIILSDWSVPGFGGLKALDLRNELDLDIPFIIVSGKIGEEAAVDILRRGAYDYVSKDNLSRVGQSVRNALLDARRKEETRRVEAALRASESKYRAFMEATQDVVFLKTLDGRYVMVNRAAESHFGRPTNEILGKTAEDLWPEHAKNCDETDSRAIKTGAIVTAIDHRNGRVFETRKFPIQMDETWMIGGYIRDVTEEHLAERELEIEVKISSILREHNTSPEIITATLELYRSLDTVLDARFEPSGNDERPEERKPDTVDGHRPVSIQLPLVAQNQSVGKIMLLCSREPDDQDLDIYLLISRLVAAAINVANLREETQDRLGRLNAISLVDESISRDADLETTLDLVLDQTMALLKVDAAAIFLLDESRIEPQLAVAKGFRHKNLKDHPVKFGNIDMDRSPTVHELVRVSDLVRSNPEHEFGRILQDEGFLTMLDAPLIVKSRLLGAIGIYSRHDFEDDSQRISFFEIIARQAAIAIQNKTLYRNEQKAREELEAAYDATIEGWSRAMDLRDKETEGHSRRVTELALDLARRLGVEGTALVNVRRGALLHDIGKVAVPDGILLKPGPLNDEEWIIMKKHPVFALDMLSPIEYLRPALDIPYLHHEKWDGSGYPRGLSGTDIPLAARIFAIIDVWDALTSDRPYRKAWPVEKARSHIMEQSGRHFDPEIVKAFSAMIPSDPVV